MTFTPAKWPRTLRSQHWYAGTGRDSIYHRGWLKNQGYPHDLFDGRPVIGILNTWSDLTPCNGHLRELAEKVKAGIWEAGGFPVEVPVFSASENTFRPTAMMYRNLAAMAVEETMRAQPIDGAVLLVGCDKTTPSLLMAAASTDIPSIVVTGGPMLNGWFRGERVGSGTALWQMSEDIKAGKMTPEDFLEAEQAMSRSSGTCNTMGTASSMASMAEALGMALSGNAAIPAVDSRRRVMAQLSGRRIVQMVKDDLKPSDVMTRAALSEAMADTFGLEAVYLVPEKGRETGERVVAAGAMWLTDLVERSETLGVAWGATVFRLADHLPQQRRPGMTVVQLLGSMDTPYGFSAEACSALIAERFGARCVNLHAPAVLSDAALAAALSREPVIAAQLDAIRRCDAALFAVGLADGDSQVVRSGVATRDELVHYTAQGACGVIAGHFIDEAGRVLGGPLDGRLIGVSPDALRAIPKRIVISAGVERAAALAAALRGGFATHVITDAPAARVVLERGRARA